MTNNDHDPATSPEPVPTESSGRWVSTEDAARILGVSVRTVRRRIDTGALKGERVDGSHAYRVWVDSPEAGDTSAADDRARGGESASAPDNASSAQDGEQLPTVPGDALSWVLADHLAELTRANAELVKRIEQLAAENGAYKERIRTLEAQAAALPAGEPVTVRRAWWQRLLGRD